MPAAAKVLDGVKAFNAARAGDIAEQAASHFNDPATAGKLFVPNAREGLSLDNTVSYAFASIDEAFPPIDAGEIPAGNQVLFQIRQPKLRTAGGLVLDTETRKTDHYNTTVAKVVACGPLAFRNRETGQPWPEGAWCKPGDFVRIPRYQGERFFVDYERDDFEIDDQTRRRRDFQAKDQICFVLHKDLCVVSIIADPLKVKAFV